MYCEVLRHYQGVFVHQLGNDVFQDGSLSLLPLFSKVPEHLHI